MDPVHQYLTGLHDIHLTGGAVAETSFYPPLIELLNDLGRALDPRVHCQAHPKDQGAGIPDMGLYTADQLKAGRKKAAAAGAVETIPARGVIEAKGVGASLIVTVESPQVAKYVVRYGQVLVTNFRAFQLVTRGPDGEAVPGERYELAEGEKAFWKAAAHPQATARAHGTRFTEFLKRVLLSRAQLASPRDLAFFLASYARDALARIEEEPDQPGLAAIRQALEQALGISFSGEKGEHFFRSTLVQTLFYGIFSAWVLWAREHPPTNRRAKFKWREAAWTLHLPMIQPLFSQIATPTTLGKLDLVEVLDWSEDALNRVDRAAFFQTFEQAAAVQYFYEPFLEAFDPALRKELGVWYTPREVVQYMVARVDTALREELKIADGLADPRVVVLDPCCGTGAYLVEVLRKIEETLKNKGGDALLGQDLKRAATERVFGFEILPAPFVVSHLQLGLLLSQAGAPLEPESSERVGVFLTNALTGWEPAREPKQHLMWPELEQERDAADEVKQERKILVILGNPPYNGFAGMAVAEERVLTDAYRETLRAPRPQGQGLNDLYVRFYRMAERKIVDSGEGVVCFISNYSWLDGLSFTGMRERYLEVFDRIWVDCLNGDKYKTGKLTPEGKPDPSIFSTEQNREGIQVGTAIATLVRKKKHASVEVVHFRHFWGSEKRAELGDLAEGKGKRAYEGLTPIDALGLPLVPTQVSAGYTNWPELPELFPVSFPGVKTSRDDVVVDIDRDKLLARMEQYFDSELSHDEIARIMPAAMDDAGGFDAVGTRTQLLKLGLSAGKVVRYLYRPFDVRWLYWEGSTKLLDRSRVEYLPHLLDDNLWFEARQKLPQAGFDRGAVTSVLGDNLGNGLSNYFPLMLLASALEETLFSAGAGARTVPNISPPAESFIRMAKTEPAVLFRHAIATVHSGAYRVENAGALRQDWPRIPLPAKHKQLAASAALGEELARLLDPETAAPGVSTGTIRPELKVLGVLTRTDGKQVNPKVGHLDITAGWGHAGKGGVTMPARGKSVEREYTKDEVAALTHGGAEWRSLLGQTTRDIYLNDHAYWANVPERVWEYTLGGYQVIKKWLSYREQELLGRGLTVEEARYVGEMVRRIAAILLLGPALDANYAAVKADTWPWPGGTA